MLRSSKSRAHILVTAEVVEQPVRTCVHPLFRCRTRHALELSQCSLCEDLLGEDLGDLCELPSMRVQLGLELLTFLIATLSPVFLFLAAL